MTRNDSNAMSLSHVTAECVAWSAIDMERKGVKMKKIQKSHVRLSVYDCVDVGFSRSMRCKELSTIFSQCFTSMLVWNMRRQMIIQTKGAWVSNSHLGSVG